MVRFLIHRPKWIVVAVGILIFWLTQTQWLTTSNLWQKAEGTLIDRRYLLRGENFPDPRIKLVGLGTSSFKLDTLAPELKVTRDTPTSSARPCMSRRLPS